MNNNHQMNDNDDNPNPRRAIGTGTLVLGALVLLFRLARCASYSQRPVIEAPVMPPITSEPIPEHENIQDVDFKVSIQGKTVEPPQAGTLLINLTIRYQVTNRRTTPILLLNRMPKTYRIHDHFPQAVMVDINDPIGKFTHDSGSTFSFASLSMAGSSIEEIRLAKAAYVIRSSTGNCST
jgi:hypothetical protein